MNYAILGRDQLIAELDKTRKEKEGLEREVVRWTAHVKQLERRIEQAQSALSGKVVDPGG